MATELVMPKLGLTMTEGLITEWLIDAGASFKTGEVILVIETDKIANEVEAQADGTMAEILVPAGETVACGTPIARLAGEGDAGEESTESATPDSTTTPERAAAPVTSAAATSNGASGRGADAGTNGTARPSIAAAREPGARVIATPFARRLARELSVDLAAVTGSGPRGRIKAPDVRAAAAAGQSTHAAPVAVATPSPASTPVQAPTAVGPTLQLPAGVQATRRPASGFELTTARKLTEAKQVPHFYLSTEIEVSALQDLRASLNRLESGPKVSLTHLLVAALARTLADLPDANRVWDNGEVVEFSTVDIGMAISTERGLMAPLLRDVAGLRVFDIAARARELVERTRNGRLTAGDMGGGATSISNAGMHDVSHMSSIITPGQSSIFGIGSVREVFRPDDKGQPALRREMGVVMSCDHRVLDGVGGLAVLNRLKSYLENPLQIVV